jgi:hypothetical protein
MLRIGRHSTSTIEIHAPSVVHDRVDTLMLIVACCVFRFQR